MEALISVTVIANNTDHLLREILSELSAQTQLLQAMATDLHSLLGHVDDTPTSLDFKFTRNPNQPKEATMAQEDGTGTIGTTSVAVPTELNAENQSIPITPANIQWTTADPTIATVTTNPANGDGEFQCLAAGETGVTVTDTSNNLTKAGTLTVSMDGKAVSIDFTWQGGSAAQKA